MHHATRSSLSMGAGGGTVITSGPSVHEMENGRVPEARASS